MSGLISRVFVLPSEVADALQASLPTLAQYDHGVLTFLQLVQLDEALDAHRERYPV